MLFCSDDVDKALHRDCVVNLPPFLDFLCPLHSNQPGHGGCPCTRWVDSGGIVCVHWMMEGIK